MPAAESSRNLNLGSGGMDSWFVVATGKYANLKTMFEV
jgi:hypothetical protein